MELNIQVTALPKRIQESIVDFEYNDHTNVTGSRQGSEHATQRLDTKGN